MTTEYSDLRHDWAAIVDSNDIPPMPDVPTGKCTPNGAWSPEAVSTWQEIWASPWRQEFLPGHLTAMRVACRVAQWLSVSTGDDAVELAVELQAWKQRFGLTAASSDEDSEADTPQPPTGGYDNGDLTNHPPPNTPFLGSSDWVRSADLADLPGTYRFGLPIDDTGALAIFDFDYLESTHEWWRAIWSQPVAQQWNFIVQFRLEMAATYVDQLSRGNEQPWLFDAVALIREFAGLEG